MSQTHAEYMAEKKQAEYAAKGIQTVRLVGIARFACWWFVVLSMLGIVVALLSIIGR